MAGRPVILFRCDATASIGAGHLMRCLALAEGFRRSGRHPVFVTQGMSKEMSAVVRRRKFSRVALRPGLPTASEGAALASLKTRGPVQGIVIDRYGLPRTYLSGLRRQGKNWTALQFDDVGKPLADVDLILNQNMHAKRSMYPLASRGTRFLLGSRYSALRPEFLSRRPRRTAPSSVRHIVVTAGGGSQPETLSRLARWTATEARGANITVVSGFSLRKSLSGIDRNRVRVLSSVKNMAALLGRADLAVTAAGTTLIELAYLRVPTLCVVLADNQVPGARAANRAGVVLSLGRMDRLDETDFRRVLRRLIDAPAARRSMMGRQARAVDGKGVKRVIAAFDAMTR